MSQRPTQAELARYRRDIPSLKWISPGIGEQLLAEIDWLLAEMDRREREAFEAGREAGWGQQDYQYRDFDDYKAAQAKEGE
jgi:hypothetical protein